MASGIRLDRPVTGGLRQKHWVVPVDGLTCNGAAGVVEAIAAGDGSVVLELACGGSRAVVRLDVCRAAQLSTGIWEAAGASQQLIGCLGDDQSASSEVWPVTMGSRLSQNASDRGDAPAPVPRRRPSAIAKDVVAGADAPRVVGRRLRRVRQAQGKSLVVVAGLAGMGKSTLSRIERGERELSLSEIVALAGALQINPVKLVVLPIPQHGQV